MIEINVTNFLTVGIMAMVFFAISEIVKKKLNLKSEETKEKA
jgi:hypothetical protein